MDSTVRLGSLDLLEMVLCPSSFVVKFSDDLVFVSETMEVQSSL